MMSDAAELLAATPIVPVVVIDDAGKVGDLIAALVDGGIHCAEITLRTPAGLAALQAASAGDFQLGAGTVTTPRQVDEVADAGASFIVSPGYDDDVVDRALERGLAVLPGAATATEVQRAQRNGLNVVKFFPADRLGGLGTISALAAPFPGMAFVPSGGVTPDNVGEYLAHPAVPAVSGSWMVRREWIDTGRFDEIRAASARATRLARTMR